MNRKGFTLIELLVVVAVLALLASIVFSNLGGAREGARISNALSFQSQTHSLLGSDLIGWWNFNDLGDILKDLSGEGNSGKWKGTNDPVPSDKIENGVPGTSGNALNFDGVSDYIVTTKDFGYAGDFTVSVWLKRDAKDNWVRSVDFSLGDYPGLVGIHQNNQGFFGYRRLDNSVPAVYYNLDGYADVLTWFHVVIIKKDTGDDWPYVYAFVNGNLSNSQKLTEIKEDYNGFVRMGGEGNRSWNGSIDDVRIYSRALSAQEVETLYAQTKERYLADK